jgi:hypothetical protein
MLSEPPLMDRADFLLQTEFYHASSAVNNGKIIYNLFSECKPEIHSAQKRPVSKYFALNGILTLEPHIDNIIQYFCQRLDEKFVDGPNASQVCDLGEWITYCKAILILRFYGEALVIELTMYRYVGRRWPSYI